MRKINLIMSLLIFTFFSCEQKEIKNDEKVESTTQVEENDEISQSLKESFEISYPNSNDVEWSKEEDKIEVEFEFEGNEMEIEYSLNGEMIEIETELKSMEDIPQTIHDYLSENYKEFKVEEAKMVKIIEKGFYYEVEIEKEDLEDGDENQEEEDQEEEDNIELVFDEEGNFLKLEKED